MLRPSERTASRCRERCTPPTTTTPSAATSVSLWPAARCCCFVSLLPSTPVGPLSPPPWCLFLLCLPHTVTLQFFSSLCHLFYLSSAVWLFFFLCRDVCTLEGRAPGYRFQSNLHSQGASGCGLCQACRHLLLPPFSFPHLCNYCLFLSLSPPPSLVLCCVPFLIARAGAEKKMLVVLCNWMSCALFLMLHAFVTILFYFFLPIQWHYIVARFLSLMLETLLVCYCWAAFTKLAL